MKRKLLWIAIVGLIVALVGLNAAQWHLHTKRLLVEDLPPAAATVVEDGDEARVVEVPRGVARSLILLIGDGMGVVHVAAASARRHGPVGRLHMERMAVTGLLRTESASHLVTDSAAAATAISTGVSVANGRVAEDDAGRPLTHLVERAARAGRSTGILTTDEVTAATPASFAAHSPHRDRVARVARSLLDSPLDLLVGGGANRFDDDLRAAAVERRWTVAESEAAVREAGEGRLLGLLAPGLLPVGGEGPALADLTRLALDRLARDPDGFILVIEEARIDKRSHWWEGTAATDRVLDLDDAVAVAMRFAREHPDTLVVVTADHECGGLALTTRPETPMDPVAGFRTHGHSAAPVPLFAEGPGAEALTGVMRQTELNRRLRLLLDLPDGSSAPPR